MIKNSNLNYYAQLYCSKWKQIQSFTSIFVIFILSSILLVGSISSSWNAIAQDNETDSVPEVTIETPSDASTKEDNKGSNPEILTDDSTNTTLNGDENSNAPSDKSQVSETPVSNPDGDCLFDPSLPKCAPDENGNCPEGFARNGDDQCYPRHDRCPEGYHSHEDDESGRCIPDDVPCDPGFIMNPDYPSCENKDRVCQDYPDLEACKEDDVTNNLSYRSGYSHGCSDSKVSDTSERYINQPGKGPGYHTNEFMRGYNDGFESCSGENNHPSSPSTSKEIFKVIVEVSNQSPRDIAGGITISIDHDPENLFKSAYNIYFPAGQMTLKTFTFKSSDVPIGTEFEVNIDYGDDYNQRQFGENSPEKRPEVVSFSI